MSAVQSICCASLSGCGLRFGNRQPAGLKIQRLPVSIVCSTNGKAGGRIDRVEDSYNGRFATDDDISARSRENYSQQEVHKKNFEPASGREVPEGEHPFRLLEDGQKVYLDELDVISLLEPPPFLRPFKSVDYNHAAFLWKKIGDIPEERRHRLLDLLLPKHITKMWELAKLRYDDPDLFVEDAEGLIYKLALQDPSKHMIWDGRVVNVPWYYVPFSRFRKVFFSKNGKVYGRTITGGWLLEGVQAKVAPLYFEVQPAEQVMATDEYCDLAFEYGDGQMHQKGSTPAGFPEPRGHISPFNDNYLDYIRAVGPGVVVGQGWVEGRDLDQVPRRFCGEFLLVQKLV